MLLVLGIRTTHAVTLPFYEPFPANYGDGTPFAQSQATNVWSLGTISGSDAPYCTNAAGQSYSGLVTSNTSLGLYVPPTTGGTIRARAVQFLSPVSNGIYASFLMNLQTPCSLAGTNRLVAAVRTTTSTTATTAALSLWLTNSGELLIGKSTTNNNPLLSAGTAALNAGTHLIVINYRYSGPAGADDVVSLWIDPPSNTFGATESNRPSASVTAGANSTDASASSSFQTLALHQNYQDSGSYFLDELRIGTNWAQVTPSSVPPVCTSASITASPTNATVTAGSNATFTVIGGGSSPTYDWQTNSGAGWFDAGEHSTSFSMAAATNANGLQLRCLVNVACDGSSVTSAPATLTVTCPALQIINAPTNQTTTSGSAAAFTITAAGYNLTYQWQTNNGGGWFNATGATNASYSLAGLSTNLTGLQVRCAVTSGCDGATTNSAAATLTVTEAFCLTPPSGLKAWWPGEGSAYDIAGQAPATLHGGVSFSTGKVGGCFEFNGTNGYFDTTASNILFSGPFTIEMWINFQSSPSNMMVCKGADANLSPDWALGISSENKLRLHANISKNWSYYDCATTLTTGTWYHVVMTYNQVDLRGYVNGVLDGTLSSPGIMDTSALPLRFGAYSPSTGAGYYRGQIDEPTLYNRALSAAEIASSYAAGSLGKCKGQLIPSTPFIAVPPASQTNYAGVSTLFEVNALGILPLTYQWRLNGTNLVGATNSGLTLANVQPINMGLYQVVVSNISGMITSAPASLTVISNCASGNSDIKAWWPGEGNASDIAGLVPSQLHGGVTFTNGMVGNCFNFNGSNAFVEASAPNVTFSGRLTVELWMNFRVNTAAGIFMAAKGKMGALSGDIDWALGVASNNKLRVHAKINGTWQYFDCTNTLTSGTWYHVAMTYDQTNLCGYVNGVLDGRQSFPGTLTGSTNSLFLGAYGPNNSGLFFPGRIDEATLYNRALSGGELAGIYLLGSAGKCTAPGSCLPPTVTAAPVNWSGYEGATASFSITTSGYRLTYQWQTNNGGGWFSASRATNTTYSLTSVSTNLNGLQVRCAVTSGCDGAITNSAAATLTVSAANPCATTPAGLVSWWPGESNTTDVAHYLDGTLIGGVTYAPAEVGSGFKLNGTNAYVQVLADPAINFSNTFTAEAWVNFTTPISSVGATIFARGIDGETSVDWALVINGDSHKLRPHAQIGGVWRYFDCATTLNTGTWYHVAMVYDGTALRGYVNGTLDGTTDASGAVQVTTNPLRLGAYAPVNGTSSKAFFKGLIDEPAIYNRALSAKEIGSLYHAGSSGRCGLSTLPPFIVTPPAARTNSVGSVGTFTVEAGGSPALVYTWQRSGTNLADSAQISGTGTSTLTLSNLTTADAGSYQVIVSNTYGSVTSAAAGLTVIIPAPVFSVQPGDRTVTLGTDTTFSALVTNTPVSYQWFKAEQALAGATNSSLTLSNIQVADAGTYRLQASNVTAAVYSSNAVLTVTAPAEFVATPPLFYDPFPTLYPAGSKLGEGASSNVWNYGNNVVSSISGGLTVTNAPLAYPGLLTDPNSYAIEDAVSASAIGNRSRAARLPTQLLDATNPAVYASFLLKVLVAPTNSRLIACFSGDTNYANLGSNPNALAGVWVTKSNTLAISKGGSALRLSLASSSVLSAGTHLIVLRYKYVSGNSNDLASVWADPVALGVDESAVPPATLSTTANLDVPVAGLLGSFSLVYNTNNFTFTSTGLGRFLLDEVRVGTNWASVTPRAPALPTARTLGVSNVVNSTATAFGQATAEGLSTACWFEWGADTNYGQATATQSLAAGFTTNNVSLAITDFIPGTLYHARLVASNALGVARGADVTFGSPAFVATNGFIITNECHVPFTDPGASANFNGSAVALSSAGTVDANTPGSYLLTYTATNGLGGVGTATRTVVVADTTPPTVTVLGDNPFIMAIGNAFNDPGATASDTCAGDLTASILVSPVSNQVAGLCTVNYFVTDPGGNAATNTRTVVVAAPPVVLTQTADGVSNTVANLNATVTPNGPGTTAWFEWGAGARWQHVTAPVALAQSFSGLPVSTAIAGLVPGVPYHVRAVASNAWGVVRGREKIFASTALRLGGRSRVTNNCNTAYNERGADAEAAPLALAAGGYHTVAQKLDATAFAWGYDVYGQTDVPFNATPVVGVAASGVRSAATLGDGRILCWGNPSGGLTTIPTSVSNCTAIALGSAHGIGLRPNGSLTGWGQNSYGQLKFPTNATNCTAIAAGNYHSLALRADGRVFAWGRNNYGQLNVPAEATNCIAVAAGFNHSLALRADGTVLAWGWNSSGQTAVPPGLTDVVAVAAGGYFSTALRNDGSVVLWGYGSGGLAPVPANVTNVISLTAGGYFCLAVRGDGSVTGWGQHNYDQTSILPELTRLSLPVAITGVVDTATPGTYTVTYTATNSLGGIGTATRTVIVACFATHAASVDIRAGRKADEKFTLSFANEAGKSFTVLASPDLTVPVAQWTELGSATEVSPGQYEFSGEPSTNDVPLFYRVRSP